jgi:site-specific DNA-methyltransferase (adenine-specific)
MKPAVPNQQFDMGQYPTPLWVAECLVEHAFKGLSSSDLVLEPSCGPGRFLQAIPSDVRAVGVEIDPVLAETARQLTGRRVITGDFLQVPIDFEPTAVIGNPPFKMDLVDGFLQRCHGLLPDGGRLGFILPTYSFQTAKRVAEYAEQWSISAEMIPRNIYPGLQLPLVFAIFIKDRLRRMVGFALYRETADIQDLAPESRNLLDRGEENGKSAPVWRTLVEAAIRNLGGEAAIDDIYKVIEGKRPAANRFWKEKVRQTLRRYSSTFTVTGPARYAVNDYQFQLVA